MGAGKTYSCMAGRADLAGGGGMDRFICFIEGMLIVVGAGMFGYWAGFAQDNLSLGILAIGLMVLGDAGRD